MAKWNSDNAPRNGRPLGSRNKTTAQIREALQQIYSANVEALEADLEKMTPFQRQTILDKLSGKVLPTLTQNDNTNMNTGDMKITVEYIDTPPPNDDEPNGYE